ncbi:Magnetosome protein MamQ [Azospirillaceae bacterium]
MTTSTPGNSMKDGVDEQMHRIRRSELLLAELYGKKIKTPKPRVKAVRGIHAMLVVSLLALSAVVTVAYYKINYFIMLREDAYSKSGNLAATVQRRANLFMNLIKLTLNHAALEHAVFSHTSEMRTEIMKNSKLSDTIANAVAKEIDRISAQRAATPPSDKPADIKIPDIEQILKSLASEGKAEGAIGKILAMVEQYPNIKSSETYKHMMDSLIEMEDRITMRRVEYNESLREYNTAVTSFPWRYLAGICGFIRIEYDRAQDPSMAAKDITPALYQQLVPLVRTMEQTK